MNEITLKPGEILFSQNDETDKLYFIYKGQI